MRDSGDSASVRISMAGLIGNASDRIFTSGFIDSASIRKITAVLFGSTSFRIFTTIVVGWLISAVTMSSAALADVNSEPLWLHRADEGNTAASADRVLKVGVQSNAEPFSYETNRRRDEPILAPFGGYMIEICRRVLTQMQISGPFLGYRIESVTVNASNRFEKLESGEIDMLCGPDSITLERLETYNATQPLFLSGVTYATVSQEQIPVGPYCGGVVGLLADTTSEKAGLQAISDSNELLRFDAPLDAYLAETPDYQKRYTDDDYRSFIDEVRRSVINRKLYRDVAMPSGRTRGVSTDVKTPGDCPDGYYAGPVIFYEDHTAGLDDLCAGVILYYLGDVDIIKRMIADRSNCEQTIMRRETLTREAYGVFFRQAGTRPSGDYRLDDGRLYSAFNNVLLRKMQNVENILDYEYQREFGDKQQTEDLRQFFESFKFASDY